MDADFRARLLADGSAAIGECTDEKYSYPIKFVVVATEPARHHVVVCTLCSCYPLLVLGVSPDWYKSREYHQSPRTATKARDSRRDNSVSLAPFRSKRRTEADVKTQLVQLSRTFFSRLHLECVGG